MKPPGADFVAKSKWRGSINVLTDVQVLDIAAILYWQERYEYLTQEVLRRIDTGTLEYPDCGPWLAIPSAKLANLSTVAKPPISPRTRRVREVMARTQGRQSQAVQRRTGTS